MNAQKIADDVVKGLDVIESIVDGAANAGLLPGELALLKPVVGILDRIAKKVDALVQGKLTPLADAVQAGEIAADAAEDAKFPPK